MEVERLPASLANTLDPVDIAIELAGPADPLPETAAPELSITIESSSELAEAIGQQNVLRVLAIRRLPSLRPTAD